MSAAAISTILKWVASFAAKAAWNSINNRQPAQVGQILNQISAGQNEIAKAIENLSIKAEILTSMRSILYWTHRMDEIMSGFKRSGRIDVDDQAYQVLLRALRNETSGVRPATFAIYNAVMGLTPNPQGTDGALLVWHNQAYANLSSVSNLNYFMSNYVAEMNGRVDPIGYLLRQGLVLSLFVSYSEADAQKLRDTCKERIETIINTLYNKLYPPGLRFLKPTFEGSGDQNGKYWYKFQQRDNRKNHLLMETFNVPALNSSDREAHKSGKDVWRFSLQENAHALGPMQILSAWEYGNNRRLYYRKEWTGVSGAVWSIHFSTKKDTKSTAVLFKLIPLAVTGNEAAFRIVAYLDGASKTPVTNNSNTFKSEFTILKA